MKREKVIKGLLHCTSYDDGRDKFGGVGKCGGCPYYGHDCTDRMKNDALALLKEQEWHMLTEDDDGIIHGLPGDDGQYLMTDGKDIWIDDYVDGVDDGVWLDSGRDIREIKAWIYMPELPKQDRR